MTKREAFLDMFKGPNGTYDSARVLFSLGGFFGIFSPIVFQAVALYKGQSWEPMQFSSGLGLILASFAGVGFGISQKDKGIADSQATMQQNGTPAA
jgi:hypothetical protein